MLGLENKIGIRFLEGLFIFFDLFMINFIFYLFPLNYMNPLFSSPILFHLYITLTWIVISLKNQFYLINNNNKFIYIFNLVLFQFTLFFLVLYAYIGFLKQPLISRLNLGYYFLICFFVISSIKFIIHFLLMRLRQEFGFNVKRIVVIGKNDRAQRLITIFNEKKELGYQLVGQFDLNDEYFCLESCLEFISENNIEEIFCSFSDVHNEHLTEIINYADNNLKKLKFVPDNNIYATKLKFEYYEYVPVLSLRDAPLDRKLNALAKRIFDVVFSTLIILGLLSWLVPLLAIIIRLESKGPIFFRQLRNGIDNKPFYCYKFRSMSVNSDSDKKWAARDDVRVTKIGKFIRKTSIDELPQFYNVFFGKMSVVGPRPHPLKLTDDLAKKHNKFMVRHLIKPGITGLAQVKGERGGIETDMDGLNRLRYDIFYVENWSMILDLKIIVLTILNAIRGEDKAY